ncbi:MAG: hypothetical protein BGO69_11535 [Bacteroidetes bacterium 46-16]|nr:MAG: hypothetical protein BGO69_11535 [Bacteroidetes bacterium 46-16]
MFLDRKKGIRLVWLIGLGFFFLFTNIARGQNTVIKGHVREAGSKKPLPFVSVFFPNSPVGTNTNDNGYFELKGDKDYNKVQISYVGYKTIVRKVTPGQEQTLNISLEPDTRELKEVTVKLKKVRYRNKNNPAVDLIREVIDHKSQNKMEHSDYVEYEQYEKLSVSLINTPDKLKNNRLLRSFKYITRNIDTTTFPDKALMPLYMQEQLSQHYYRKSPEKNKTIITGEKKVNFGEYIDNQGLKAYLKHMYQDVDIYKNNISLMTNQFLSPIADMGPTFYQYFIVDTTEVDGQKLVGLSFFPRNKTDMLFQGRLYVTMNGDYAVQKVIMTVNKNININWIRDLDVTLNFEKGNDGKYHLSKSDVKTDFGLSSKKSSGIYGQRTVSFKNYLVDVPRPDSIYQGESVVEKDGAEAHDSEYWLENRHDTLTLAESRTYANSDSLRNSKTFKRTMDIITLFIAGYKRASPYFEVGPVNTFYSFNPVEGFRLRLGGRTTPNLSKRYYFETYGAYGFKDKQWKYYFGGTYSFTGRSIYEFPVKILKANYQKDTKIPGQELQFIQEDNVLLSIKRGVNDKWLYNNIYNITYLNEFKNHLSFQLGYKNWKQQPAGALTYITSDAVSPSPVPDITTSEFSLELRYAPHEDFYQGKLYRIPIPNRYPVFSFRTIAGVKDFLGGQYNYQNFTLNIYKRVYMSQLGYSDVALEGGYIAGRVPFPLLAIHRANQTYSLQLQSYNMMNFLEFVSDHYASLIVDHCFNGFVFNKIPLFRRLRFREYANVKILYGGVRDENMPANNGDLLQFPKYPDGTPATYTLEQQPYIEGSLGIGNILNFFRIDVVKRFTYLDHPEVSQIGIRGRFKFDF